MATVSTDRRQGVNSSAAVKVPCRVATTANITLSGEQTIDGVAVVTDDRVLVKDQTTGSENGIWDANTSSWTRAPDWDGAYDVKKGTLVYAHSGTVGNGWWNVTTADTITVGTTSVTIAAGLAAPGAIGGTTAAAGTFTTLNSNGIADNATSNAITINSDDSVNMGSQPAFQVAPASQQSNIAVSSWVNVALGTEVFDVGGDFASDTFTAPVTGKYLLTLMIELLDVDTASVIYQIRFQTSNRNYQPVVDPNWSADLNTFNFSLVVVADMDANDTAFIDIYQNGGTQQTDIGVRTVFSGYLAA